MDGTDWRAYFRSRSAATGNSPGQGHMSSASLDAVRDYQAISTKRRASGAALEAPQPSRNPFALGTNH